MSDVSKFTRAREREITLPMAAEDGSPLTVKIRRIARADFIRLAGGIPDLGTIANDDPQRRVAGALSALEVERRLVEACVTEPRITFGDEPEVGAAWWEDFPEANRRAVVEGITNLQGLSASPDGGAAEKAATFPALSGGNSNR